MSRSNRSPSPCLPRLHRTSHTLPRFTALRNGPCSSEIFIQPSAAPSSASEGGPALPAPSSRYPYHHPSINHKHFTMASNFPTPSGSNALVIVHGEGTQPTGRSSQGIDMIGFAQGFVELINNEHQARVLADDLRRQVTRLQFEKGLLRHDSDDSRLLHKKMADHTAACEDQIARLKERERSLISQKDTLQREAERSHQQIQELQAHVTELVSKSKRVFDEENTLRQLVEDLAQTVKVETEKGEKSLQAFCNLQKAHHDIDETLKTMEVTSSRATKEARRLHDANIILTRDNSKLSEVKKVLELQLEHVRSVFESGLQQKQQALLESQRKAGMLRQENEVLKNARQALVQENRALSKPRKMDDDEKASLLAQVHELEDTNNALESLVEVTISSPTYPKRLFANMLLAKASAVDLEQMEEKLEIATELLPTDIATKPSPQPQRLFDASVAKLDMEYEWAELCSGSRESHVVRTRCNR
ncbi:hypothetical protein EJ05DRAFT_537747 [Pseudovirgaria hyperparasitica]|uniref:Uncharacterized protein n=1 Tax=Pseudovirgaria hyperparasitica TaxID=470096 RepID=A0A6A6W827_9PEZI|nr:uncharacterized protein EJ05DRAFT_537747 [Pseudovirgaria hyperparasitica]KAF2758359.1 hypothetical protein EJ05DRAFT_537747 [Pseudovirgaria hyperparasitica]